MLRYGSVCSGIEAASVAWHDLGWSAQWLAEIEAFPSAVLAHRFPDTPNLGDMTKLLRNEVCRDREIDLLVGGTPCQSFSLAGLRYGMADARGGLALEFVRLAQALQPRWIIWENVTGALSSNGGRDFGSLLGALGELGYGFAYRVLDAQFFGVPQRRRRIFVVGYLGDWRRAAAVLFEREGVCGYSQALRDPESTVAALTASGVGTCGADDNQAQAGHLIAVNARQDPVWSANQTPALGAEDTGHAVLVPNVSMCLTTRMTRLDAETETFITYPHAVRRLTPLECERLQGFPDNFTAVPFRGKDIAADGPRYKAIGNSKAIPCVRWLGERIDAVDQLETLPQMRAWRLSG